MAFLGQTEETDNLFPCVRVLDLIRDDRLKRIQYQIGSQWRFDRTHFIQSENNTAEPILNFLKFSNTAFVDPIK